MSRKARFWDKVAERYSRKPVADESAYQEKLRVTREYFRPDMEVLEIGCGTGSTAIAHAPYVRHIRATDISPKMIEIAKGKAGSRGVTNVSFDVADVDDLAIADETLDAVLGLSILHLLEDKEAAIARVFEMLKPGGVFVTSTMCIADSMKWFKYVAPIGKFFGVFPLVKAFTRQELTGSLRGAGFDIDYEWQPGKGAAVFIVARKPE